MAIDWDAPAPLTDTRAKDKAQEAILQAKAEAEAKLKEKSIKTPINWDKPTKTKSKIDWDKPSSTSTDSALKVFGKSASKSAIVGVGSLPGMAAGAEVGAAMGLPLAPVTAGLSVPIGAVIGGLGGAFASGAIINAGIDSLPEALKVSVGMDNETVKKGREAHPESAFTGDLIGGVALFGPGKLKAIEYAKDKFISPLVQRVGMAGFSTGMEAIHQVQEGKFDPAHLAVAAGSGYALAKPTKITNSIGGLFSSRTPVNDPGSKAWTGKRIKEDWTPPTETADGIPIQHGRIKDAEGKQAYFEGDSTRPKWGRLHRDEEGNPTHIQLDTEAIKEAYTKGDAAKFFPNLYTKFKSADELSQFVLAHEEAHTRSPQGPEEPKAEYEQRVNQMALDHIRENPIIALPEVDPIKVPEKAASMKVKDWLSDTFYSLGKNKEADKAIGRLRLESAIKEDGMSVQDKTAIRQNIETGKPLDERLTGLANKYYGAELQEVKDLQKWAQSKKLALPVEMDESITGAYFPSKLIPKKVGILEGLKESFSGGDKGGFDPALTRTPGAAKERGFFAGESNGKRVILQHVDDGKGTILQWNNGKKSVFMRGVDKLEAGDKLGSYSIKNRTLDEVEQHTPYTYEKDSQAVLYNHLADLRELKRGHDHIDNLIKSDWFKENAQKTEVGVPMKEGFRRPSNLDKLPQFDGYAFEKRASEIIEDFAKNWEPNALTHLSGALIKNMMLNPIPHMFNEAWHLFNARGLTGWVTPPGISRFAKTAVPAIKHVMHQSPEFLETLRMGGSLLSANVRNNEFEQGLFNKANKEFMKTPEALELAKGLGMALPKLYNFISQKSNQAMWVVRDAMVMQNIQEHMDYKGMTREEAVKETERHMPSYRIGERVGEGVLKGTLSRSLSQVLQNPNVSVFSRYHYGLIKSLVETGKDISAIRKGKDGFVQAAHGVDQLAAMAVAISVLYPLQDMIAHQITGNPDAKQRRAGPYHIAHAIGGIMANEKDPMAAMSSIFTFNPALLTGAQLIADRQLYNGQPIYHPEDSAAKIAYDIGKYLVTQMPLVGQEMKAQKEEDGFKAWAARQIDVESPTVETVAKRAKQAQKKTVAGARRTSKWENE